jgi:hypothetical protein
LAVLPTEIRLPWSRRTHRYRSIPLAWPLLLIAAAALGFPLYQWYEGLRWLRPWTRPAPSAFQGYIESFPLWMRDPTTIAAVTIACCVVAALAAEVARRGLTGSLRVLAAGIFAVACITASLTLFIAP